MWPPMAGSSPVWCPLSVQRLGELPPPQTTDPDTERYLLYAAVVGLLEEASRQRPVVVVLDDLHWADKPSLQLLRHVVANTSATRLLILGTYRDGELSAAHPLTEALAALHREPTGVSTSTLKGLDDTGVIAFMESAAGHELDDAGVGLAHQLYRETDGNPFFVAEVLRNLVGVRCHLPGRPRDAGRPATPRAALPFPTACGRSSAPASHASGTDATKVLSTASVIGRDFDLDLLAETITVDEDELIDLLDEAQRAAVVARIPDVTWALQLLPRPRPAHPLRGPRVRRGAPGCTGRWVRRSNACTGRTATTVVGELARHFLLATRPTDTDKAISYARRAGEAALAALAPDDAVRYFSQALELAAHAARVDPLTAHRPVDRPRHRPAPGWHRLVPRDPPGGSSRGADAR